MRITNVIEINKSDRLEIARYLSIFGAVRIKDFGVLRVKKYKTRLKNPVTKEIEEVDSAKIYFKPHTNFKSLLK